MKRAFIVSQIVLLGTILVSCAGNKGPERFYFGNYSEAEEFYNKGQHEKAIEKYQAYIDENPEGNLAVISNYYMAKSHVALGNIDQAKAIYQAIVDQYPDLVWANFAKTQLKELEEPAQKS